MIGREFQRRGLSAHRPRARLASGWLASLARVGMATGWVLMKVSGYSIPLS